MCNAVFRTPFSRCPLDGTKLAELSSDPLVGTVLDKRYHIEECIGEGGMGRVYRAKHTRMSRHFAIKILFGDHAGDTRMRSRFAREAEAVSRLSHTNVISVVDFGETEEGLLYLVMDLADGSSLAEIVHREAPFDPRRVVEIMARLAKGLAHAHNHGLVHRDFKCENVIMVQEEGVETPKIVDFGICMIVEDAPASTMLTSNGMIMGTPAVMAPEQASGDKVDNRTDLFSLGIVGYQMLSGCLPFEGTPLEMARKNLYEAIPSIASRSGVSVDPAFEAVIHKLTAKSPKDRYQDAAEFLEALKDLAIPGAFDAWTNVTPMPGALRSGSDSGPVGTDNTEMVSPIGSGYGGVGSTSMIGFKRKRSWLALSALVLVGAAAGIFVITNSSGETGETKSSVASASLETSDHAAGAAVVDDEPTTNETKSAAEPDATVPAIEEPPAGEGETAGTAEDTNKADDSAKLATDKKDRNKNPRNKGPRTRNKTPKNTTTAKASDAEQQALQKKTKNLFYSVSKSLDTLEQQRGKAAVASLRNDFDRISLSRLIREPSMQPEYYQGLMRLRAQILARRKKK